MPQSARPEPVLGGWGRFVAVLLAFAVVLYGIHGVIVDDLWLPSTGRRSRAHHYHGAEAAWMCVSLACLAVCGVVHAFSHHDPAAPGEVTNRWPRRLLLAAALLSMFAGALIR